MLPLIAWHNSNLLSLSRTSKRILLEILSKLLLLNLPVLLLLLMIVPEVRDWSWCHSAERTKRTVVRDVEVYVYVVAPLGYLVVGKGNGLATITAEKLIH